MRFIIRMVIRSFRWLTETKDEYVYDEYEENDVVDSEDDESSVAATEAQTESAVDGSQRLI